MDEFDESTKEIEEDDSSFENLDFLDE